MAKIKAGACCDCGGPNPCALECRSKAGIAELCGFEAFTTPEVPPKKYRQRRYTGSMEQQHFPASVECDADCPGAAVIAWSGTIALSPFTYTAALKLTLNSVGGGLANYTLNGLSGDDNDDGSESPLNASHVRGYYQLPGGTSVYISPGASVTFDVAPGTEFSIGVEFNYVYWHGGPSQCITAGQPPLIHDSWALQQTHDEDTCELTESDASARDMEGSPPAEIPCERPSDCYGGGATVTEDSLNRFIAGIGCVPDGVGGSDLTEGVAQEILENEDTEDDAIARATAALEWSDPPGPCDGATAFITARGAGSFVFAFREVEVRATIGSGSAPLIVGHVYNVRIYFRRRILGTGGPFLPYAIAESTLVAAGDTATGSWIEVPHQAGYEAKAAACQVQDITAP